LVPGLRCTAEVVHRVRDTSQNYPKTSATRGNSV
jgi:hypothetical protein